jgi:hypothetical protein
MRREEWERRRERYGYRGGIKSKLAKPVGVVAEPKADGCDGDCAYG